MNKLGFLLFCFAIGIILSCNRNVYVSCLSWQNAPVVVDGNMSEWPNPLRFYDYKSKINYSITNDRKKLYICLKISDELTQYRIMEGGMEVCLDTSEKKIFPVKIMYPPGNENRIKEDNKENKNPKGNYDLNSSKKIFLGLLKEIEVKGFKYPISGILKSSNSNGISVAINWDNSGVMVYEAVLPFSTFFKDELIPADTNKAISFKFLIKPLPFNEDLKSNKSQQEDGNITGRSSNSGINNEGLNSNVYGTGPVGYGNSTRPNTGVITNPIYEPLDFKIKVKFSYQ